MLFRGIYVHISASTDRLTDPRITSRRDLGPEEPEDPLPSLRDAVLPLHNDALVWGVRTDPRLDAVLLETALEGFVRHLVLPPGPGLRLLCAPLDVGAGGGGRAVRRGLLGRYSARPLRWPFLFLLLERPRLHLLEVTPELEELLPERGQSFLVCAQTMSSGRMRRLVSAADGLGLGLGSCLSGEGGEGSLRCLSWRRRGFEGIKDMCTADGIPYMYE